MNTLKPPLPTLIPFVLLLCLFSRLCVADGLPCSRYYNSPNDAEQVFVDGTHAYLANGSGGLHILDVGDPSQISLLSVLPTTNGTMGVSVVGNTAYTADGYNGLRCYDVSDPMNPVLVGDYVTGQFVSGIAVRNEVAYILDSFPTTESLGLMMIDVSDPSAPNLLGILDEFFYPQSLLLHGDLALIPDASQGLKIIDISDPANPILVSTIENLGGGWSTAVEVMGNLIYISESSVGIKVYDISNPAQPTMVDLFDRPAGFGAFDLLIDGNRLYIASYSVSWEVLVLDITVPDTPWLLGNITSQTPGSVTGLAFSDGSLYFGTAEDGIIDHDPDNYRGESGMMILNTTDADCKTCRVDLTLDGVVNFFDVSMFLLLFAKEIPIVDYNDDGTYNFFDVSAFLTAYAEGCP